ncbi:hypothetical protein EDD18DRAFT_1409201 [Armillaria luteobubalina]|uniref:Uncharacterized protein n=1 Tax=Armillaria luteobubalina TaxID=153913 RepID=A0AA39PY27_9AGAR|nr:hypothetical protein EDD18DRAFT_1409201 [Armillaria luteobubalina]
MAYEGDDHAIDQISYLPQVARPLVPSVRSLISPNRASSRLTGKAWFRRTNGYRYGPNLDGTRQASAWNTHCVRPQSAVITRRHPVVDIRRDGSVFTKYSGTTRLMAIETSIPRTVKRGCYIGRDDMDTGATILVPESKLLVIDAGYSELGASGRYLVGRKKRDYHPRSLLVLLKRDSSFGHKIKTKTEQHTIFNLRLVPVNGQRYRGCADFKDKSEPRSWLLDGLCEKKRTHIQCAFFTRRDVISCGLMIMMGRAKTVVIKFGKGVPAPRAICRTSAINYIRVVTTLPVSKLGGLAIFDRA